MNNESLNPHDELLRVVGELCDVIDVPANKRQLSFTRTDDGSPHIEILDGTYHYVVTEKGSELSREVCRNLDELLYKIFQSITHEMAGKYELSHRDGSQDFRRMLFSHQLFLLRKLSEDWADKRAKEIERILSKAPYTDNDRSQ